MPEVIIDRIRASLLKWDLVALTGQSVFFPDIPLVPVLHKMEQAQVRSDVD